MPGGIHPPPSVIASWPKPNYVDPVTASRSNPIVLAILGTLSVFIVSTRMIVRFFVQRNAGLDDYLMLAALIPTYALAVCSAYATEVLDYNRHIWDVPPETILSQRKMNMAIAALYIYGATLIKLSVLCFDRRLGVNKVTPKFLWAVRLAIGMVLFYALVWTVLCFRQCHPFEAYWQQFNPVWLKQGHAFSCLDEGANTLSNTVFSTLCDFIAFLLPLSLLWRLQISKKQKMALGGVFSVGLLVCVVGIVRIVYITRLYYVSYDATWEAYHVYGATAFELLLATICASAPALKIFFRGLRGRGETSGGNSNSKTAKPKSASRARSRPLFDEEGAGDGDSGGGLHDDDEANVRMQELELDKSGAAVRQEEDTIYEMKHSSTNTSTPGEYEGLEYGNLDDGMSGYGSRASSYPLRKGDEKSGAV